MKTLFENKWIEVVELNGWFTATKPVQSKDNKTVAVLPYRIKDNKKEFISRFELNPAHLDGEMNHQVSIITGACETGDPLFHARMELREEAGYEIPEDRFMFHGIVRTSKTSMSKMHLYSVKINESDEQLAYSGDGSGNEAKEYAEWVSYLDMLTAKDPYIHTIMLRM